jgi:histidine phosphotransferase ChpT
MTFDLQILELVCSRLCHDLISPVGAVGNGLELMAEEGNDELLEDARKLVESSTQRASALLQMFRCAYGNAGNQPSFGAGEAVKLAREALDPARVEFKADLPAVADWPQGFGKVLVNAILAAVEWLPRGGTLSLAASESDGKAQFGLTVEGQGAGYSPDVARLLQLDRTGVELTAHNIQPYLTGLVASHNKFRLELSQPAAGMAILQGRTGA